MTLVANNHDRNLKTKRLPLKGVFLFCFYLVPLIGFEPMTYSLEGSRSNPTELQGLIKTTLLLIPYCNLSEKGVGSWYGNIYIHHHIYHPD